MRPFDYLRILQRRWWIPVLALLIGMLLAFVTQPSKQTVLIETAPKVQFRAQHLLIANPTATDRTDQRGFGFDRLALLTVAGPVRDAALEELAASDWPTVIADDPDSEGTEGNSQQRERKSALDPGLPEFRRGKGLITIVGPQGLVQVAPVPDPATGALAIVATGSKTSAPEAANVFAEKLLDHLDALNLQNYEADEQQFERSLNRAQSEAARLDAQISDPLSSLNPTLLSSLQSRRIDAQRTMDTAAADLEDLHAVGPAGRQLTTLDRASEKRLEVIASPGGSAMSSSQRLIVGGAIGMLLGLVLLVVMELLGARIRDVASTEGAARMPVIAEIPVVKMNRADRFVVATAADPASLSAEAYRSLRTSLLAMWQRHPRNVPLGDADTSASGSATRRGRPLRSLLVTSPGPAEGKSITVVNLAAAFAETGMTVIVIDADFRRPTQCKYLDRPRSPNLGDLDITCAAADLDAVLQDTDVPGVRLAASAPNRADPGHAIAVAKSAARVGQELADIVLVDSPPLLLANDASDIALSVDASILLARSGWTRRAGVVSSADLLRRLEAPVIGVVIVGAEHGVRAGYYGYYGYYGYGYGYAHPGEVSIVSRLMPWKARRQGGSHGSQRLGSGPVPTAPGDGVSRAAGADDPWV